MNELNRRKGAWGSRGREAKYQRLLGEQKRSGQSLRAFAASRGLSAWTLYEWRHRLGLSESGRGDGRRKSLVPVQLVRGGDASAAEKRGLEVLIGNRRILVPAGFDAWDLERLIGVIERC